MGKLRLYLLLMQGNYLAETAIELGSNPASLKQARGVDRLAQRTIMFKLSRLKYNEMRAKCPKDNFYK